MPFTFKKFIFNGLLLTASSLLLRSIAISFNVHITARIGAEAMGLFQLVLSVYLLAATFASSGISISVTRLLSENDPAKTRKIMRAGFSLSIGAGALIALLLFVLAEPISFHILNDRRCAQALRIFAPSLLLMGVSNCVYGYFFARRMIVRTTAIQLCELLIKIGSTVGFVAALPAASTQELCAALVAGNVCGEVACTLLTAAAYWLSKRQKGGTGRFIRKIVNLAVPIALSGYVRAFLRTAENLLFTWGLGKFGYTRTQALSQFGVLKAMALPVILLPSTLISSFASILIRNLLDSALRAGRSASRRLRSRCSALPLRTRFWLGSSCFAAASSLHM